MTKPTKNNEPKENLPVTTSRWSYARLQKKIQPGTRTVLHLHGCLVLRVIFSLAKVGEKLDSNRVSVSQEVLTARKPKIYPEI